MEEVLDLYEMKLPEDEVLVCMDESNKQLIGEVHQPIACKSGSPIKEDYAYIRNGTKAIFMFFAPDEGYREVIVENYKTKLEWAENMKYLSDNIFPNKKKIHNVLDNFKTHHKSAFYENFFPEEANRLMHRFTFHYTPKHASWLNMAEIEFSALFTQCLNKRIANEEILKNNIEIWTKERNNQKKKIEWKFTTADARVKLKKLYPSIQT